MQPDGCFLAEVDNQPVGTACACIFGSVAWVALVLVDASQRKRGVGTRLMQHVLQFLDDSKVPTVRLDATPLGRPIYEKLGFAADYELIRYEGNPVQPAAEPAPAANASLLEDICRFDAAVTGTDRRKFLHRFLDEHPESLRVIVAQDAVQGFMGLRPGARAVQIGPCMAEAQAGPVLLADALQRLAGQRVYIDIPVDHAGAAHLAAAAGLTEQRRLLRMTRGPRVQEKLDCLWASSGPEKG
jgi:hypothetical protein